MIIVGSGSLTLVMVGGLTHHYPAHYLVSHEGRYLRPGWINCSPSVKGALLFPVENTDLDLLQLYLALLSARIPWTRPEIHANSRLNIQECDQNFCPCNPRVLSLGTIDIMGRLIFSSGGWPVHWRMFNNISGLYPLDALGTSLLPMMGVP